MPITIETTETVTTGAVTQAQLIDAIRMQLRTWATGMLGVRIPAAVEDAGHLSALLHRVSELAEDEYGDYDDDDSHIAMAHLINADAEATWAARGHGDAHLLNVLRSLIVAAAVLA